MSLSDEDPANVQQAVERYADLLLRVAYTYMGSLSDAEDMVQTVFLKLVQKRPSFLSEEHRKAWLIRVTLNECKNALRSAWFRKRAGLAEANLGFTPEEHFVMAAVMELSPNYRSVILLYYHEGYSIREIARIMDLGESAVSSRLQRARRQLKISLEEDQHG